MSNTSYEVTIETMSGERKDYGYSLGTDLALARKLAAEMVAPQYDRRTIGLWECTSDSPHQLYPCKRKLVDVFDQPAS